MSRQEKAHASREKQARQEQKARALKRSIQRRKRFSERLLYEEHVAVVPGSAFGPSGEGHVRATLATSFEDLEEALVRIGRFVGNK